MLCFIHLARVFRLVMVNKTNKVNEILEIAGGASFGTGSTMGGSIGMGGKPIDSREQQSYAKARKK